MRLFCDVDIDLMPRFYKKQRYKHLNERSKKRPVYWKQKQYKYFYQRMKPHGAKMIFNNCLASRMFHPGTCQNESVHHFVNHTNLSRGKMNLELAMMRLWNLTLAFNIKRVRLIQKSKPHIWNRIPKHIQSDFEQTIDEVMKFSYLDTYRTLNGWYIINDKSTQEQIQTLVAAKVEECKLIITEKPLFTKKCKIKLQQYIAKNGSNVRIADVAKMFSNKFSYVVLRRQLQILGYLC